MEIDAQGFRFLRALRFSHKACRHVRMYAYHTILKSVANEGLRNFGRQSRRSRGKQLVM